MEDLVRMFREGGPFMWPILAFGVFAVAVGFERLVVVRLRARLDAAAFMAEVQRLVLAGRVDRAVQLCHAHQQAALPRVVVAGLVRAGGHERDVELAVDEALLEVAPALLRRTPYLGMLANVATLTGLLGTIQGLVQAFDAVAHAPPEVKQAKLAAGIAVAMYTTFFGLLVAIPTLVVQSVVQGATARVLDDLERHGLRTVALLTSRPLQAPAPAAVVGE